MKRMLIPLLTIFTQSHACADWLSLCHGQPASILLQKNENHLAHYLSPDESVTLLQLTKQTADSQCQQIEIGVSVKDVLWAGFAPNATKDTVSIALQGSIKDKHFLVSELILPDSANTSSEKNTVKLSVTEQSTSTKPLTRSAWFWSPSLWMETPEKIFNIKSKFGINRIYISVLTNGGEVNHPKELRAFIQLAHTQGLQVWAVLGDPRAVMNEGVSAFLSASVAYTEFNNNAQPNEKLEGLQLDIEPYLIPGYSQNPDGWLSRYAYTINNIHRTASDLELDVVLPFWFDPDVPMFASMLDNITDSIVRITVMDYRTDPAQIRRIATQFLSWGLRNKKAIDIALETLPMEQEDRRQYRQAESGELWQLHVGDKTVLLLLNDSHRADTGIKSYSYTHTRAIDGTDISFFRKKDTFKNLLSPLEADLSIWPSFSGLAIHGLDQW